MQINDYQNETHKTAEYPDNQAIAYLVIGLVNEAGEVAGKYKKHLRGDSGLQEDCELVHALADEMGDVLWYMSELSNLIGVPLDEIMERNINKLAARKANGTIKGNGDKR